MVCVTDPAGLGVRGVVTCACDRPSKEIVATHNSAIKEIRIVFFIVGVLCHEIHQKENYLPAPNCGNLLCELILNLQ